jgi:hypothetical protein
MAAEIKPGWFLELIPRDPPPLTEGLVLAGQVDRVDLPYFRMAYPCGAGWVFSDWFRLDENGELCVRNANGALFEVGRSVPFVGELYGRGAGPAALGRAGPLKS